MIFKYRRQQKVAQISSWSGSILIHVLLVILLLLITQSRPGKPGKIHDGKKVSIEVSDSKDLIAEQQPLDAIQVSALNPWAIQTPQQPDVQVLEEISQITTSEPTISMKMSPSDLENSLSGNWASFMSQSNLGELGATFFGLQARGGKFVYVVDRSASMANGRLDAARNELFHSIESLTSRMSFFIIFYDVDYLKMEAEGLVKASRHNREIYFEWARTVPAAGSTDPTKAIQFALRLKPDAIWLLSDGEFENDSVVDQIRATNQISRIPIHTIAFADNSGEDSLRLIARQNRGNYRFVSP